MMVVDASVAVKWFLPEIGEDLAQRLLTDRKPLTAPALIRVEVAAAITRKARLSEISAHEADMAVGLWFQSLIDGVVTMVAGDQDLPEAVRLALALKHPLQDCLYLALARRLGARSSRPTRSLPQKHRRHTRTSVSFTGEPEQACYQAQSGFHIVLPYVKIVMYGKPPLLAPQDRPGLGRAIGRLADGSSPGGEDGALSKSSEAPVFRLRAAHGAANPGAA